VGQGGRGLGEPIDGQLMHHAFAASRTHS